MINILLAMLGGNMPTFHTHKWNDYEIRLFNNGDVIRDLMSIIPYYWDNEIAFLA